MPLKYQKLFIHFEGILIALCSPLLQMTEGGLEQLSDDVHFPLTFLITFISLFGCARDLVAACRMPDLHSSEPDLLVVACEPLVAAGRIWFPGLGSNLGPVPWEWGKS